MLLILMAVAVAGFLAALAAYLVQHPSQGWDDEQEFKAAADASNHSLSSGSLP